MFIEYVKKGSVFIIVVIGLIVFGIFTFTKEKEAVMQEVDHDLLTMIEIEEEKNDEQDEQMEEEERSTIVVDIKGEVKKPGVYEVNRHHRVMDVISLAGGLTEFADERHINLAQKLEDEMVIYVPKEGEDTTDIAALPVGQTVISSASDEVGVRVNEASSEELQTLQGIGPAKAEAIIQYRDENGPFQQVEDLLNVSGIGEKTLDNIRDDIVIP